MTSNTLSVHVSSSGFLIKHGIKALVASATGYRYVENQREQADLVIYESGKIDEAVFQEIKQQLNKTNVLLVTASLKRPEIQRMIDLGVRSIVTDRCSREEILNAIMTTAKGGRFMCSRVLEVLMQHDEISESPSPLEGQILSPREQEVLTLITRGHTTIQIADLLHVSVHTINSHRKNMLKKFNLKSPIELIVYALENNLVEKK